MQNDIVCACVDFLLNWFSRSAFAEEKRRLEAQIGDLEEEKEDVESSLEMAEERLRKLQVSYLIYLVQSNMSVSL